MRAHIDGRQGGGVFVVFSSLVRSNAIDLSEDDASIVIAIDQEYADIGRTIVTVDDMDGDGAEELMLGSQAASSYFGQEQYVPSRLYMVFSNDIRPGRNVGIDDMLLHRFRRVEGITSALVSVDWTILMETVLQTS